MKKLINLIALLGMITLSYASNAEEGAIRFANKVFKEVIEKNDEGKDVVTYVEPDLAIPGNTMKYIITFENIIDQPISGIVINDPLPNNSKYIDGTAEGDSTSITFSADGENYDVQGKVKLKDYKGELRTVSSDKYTHIRWVYNKPLMPGEIGQVSFKTKIRKPKVN